MAGKRAGHDGEAILCRQKGEVPKHGSGCHETNETIDEMILKSPLGMVRGTNGARPQGTSMIKLRFLLIPLGTMATIAALSAQTASHATARTPVVAATTEQVVTCTDANRNTVDICIVADSVSH